MAESDVNQTLIADAIGGGSSDDIRKRLIMAMLQQGTSGEPVQHPLQGFDRLAKAMLGGLQMRDMDRADRARTQRLTNLYLAGQGGGGGSTPPQQSAALPPTPSPMPPMGVDPPPSNPPGTFNVTQATENVASVDGWPVRDPAKMRQALMGGGAVNSSMGMPGGPGSLGDQGPSLVTQQQPPPVANPAAPMVPNQVRTVSIPRPDPAAMALQPPQQPAGAMPSPLAPPGPPAAGPRPAPDPAPRANQVAQQAPSPSVAPPITPERRRALVEAIADPNTPAVFKGLFAKQLNPKIEMKEITDTDGEKVDVWINTDTQQVLGRVAVPARPRAPNSAVSQPPPGLTPAQTKIWNAEQAKRAVEGALPASDESVHKLRTQFLATKEAANMADSYGTYKSMMDSAGTNDRAADLNITAGLAKLLDPTGVVREGDIIMVQNTQAIPSWLVGQINRLNGGGGLQPVEREKIMAVAYSRMKEHYNAYENRAEFFRGIAKDSRMKPEHVIQTYKPPEKWTKAQSNVSPEDLANEILRRRQEGGGR